MAKKYVNLNTLSTFLENLKNLFATKTETDANLVTAKQYADDKTSNLLSYESQILTDDQKTQVRTNIGAISASEISNAIIDVAELPTAPSDDAVFYRLATASMISNQEELSNWTYYCVDGLPTNGTPVADASFANGVGYYNIQDGVAYGYVNSVLSSAFGVPIGWYPLSALLPVAGFSYGGIITDIADDPKDGAFRTLLEFKLYSYKEGLWTSLGAIDSEVFTVDESGTAWFAGDVFVGGTGIDGSAKMLVTAEYVDSKVSNIDLSLYETTENAQVKLDTAKAYSDANLVTAKQYADDNLNTAKTYTDEALTQKSQVQIITWEVDD